MSLAQFRAEKDACRRNLFAEEDGRVRVVHGEDTAALPSLRRCVLACRGTYAFRACVAREAETPLTELHLMQPVLGVLLLLSLLVLPLAAAVMVSTFGLSSAALRVVEISISLLAVAASGALLYVGRIAAGVPTHEQLNIALSERLDSLDEQAEAAMENAEDAQRLEGMTLGWVQARGRDRDAVRRLNAQLREDTNALWAFQFKARLLRYLSRGEKATYGVRSPAVVGSQHTPK